MGKLIDADALIEEFTKQAENNAIYGYMTAYDVIRDCIGTVEEQPTAFDVDKVVAELEFRKSYLNHNGLVVSVPVVTFENAVEIVKKGGVT